MPRCYARDAVVSLFMLLLCAVGVAADPLLEPDPLLTGNDERQIRGVLVARNHAVLASEVPGRITEMRFADGERFSSGDVLARFDCSAYQAQLNAAQASTRAAQEELNHQKQLAEFNSVGRFAVALAEARHAEAVAQAQAYQIQVRRCTIIAPFSGQVVQRRAQPHESVTMGAPLLEVVDNSSLEIHLLVPSHWLSRLQPGQTFHFTPDETGSALPAVVKRLGARIDEGSQTLLLIGELPQATSGLLAGMSGTAQFQVSQ